MTNRQAKFIHEYIIDLNATQAAIRAGFSVKAAGQVAARLLKNANIASEIAKMQDALAEKSSIDAQWVLEKLKENHARAMQAEPILDSKGKPTGEYRYDGAVANKALELIGKHIGMFVDRMDLRVNPGTGVLAVPVLDANAWASEAKAQQAALASLSPVINPSTAS